MLSILGVLADPAHGTLWICSTPNNFRSPPVAGTSALMALDLQTGKQKAVYPFPAPASACNDITIAKDGTAYASDTPNGRVFTLKRGAKELELFAQDDKLKGIDGVAFGGDGTLYLNIVSKGQMVRNYRGQGRQVLRRHLAQPSRARRWRAGRPDADFRPSVPAWPRGPTAARSPRSPSRATRPTIKVLKDGLSVPAGGDRSGQAPAYGHRGQDHLPASIPN